MQKVKAQDISLEEYNWKNTSLRYLNRRIEFGERDVIGVDLMSHLFKKKAGRKFSFLPDLFQS